MFLKLILLCTVSFLLSLSTLLYSSEPLILSEQVACSDNSNFSNSYYLIQVSDIAQVSQYFSKLSSLIEFKKENLRIGMQIGSNQLHYQYFDYPNQQLLKNNQELFLVINKLLPRYREDRETIYFLDNSNQTNPKHLFKTKNYKQKKTALDKHVLFSRVKRKDRLELQALIQYEKEELVNITPVIDIEAQEVIVLFTHFGRMQAKISMEEFHIANYGLPNTFSVLKFELLAPKTDSLTSKESIEIKKLVCNIKNDFTQKFPQIKQSPRPNYQFYHKNTHQLLPSRDLFERFPVIYKIGQASLLAFIGFLVLYLFIGRYSKVSIYKQIRRTTGKK